MCIRDSVGDDALAALHPTGRVMEGELVAVPLGNRGRGLHGVVVDDRGAVERRDLCLRVGGPVAALALQFLVGVGSEMIRGIGAGEARTQGELRRQQLVLDAKERRGFVRGIEGFGDNKRDMLAGVVDLIIGERSTPLGREVAGELLRGRNDGSRPGAKLASEKTARTP